MVAWQLWRPVVGCAGVVAAVGWWSKGRWWQWVPASYDKLEVAERKILEKSVRVPFEMTKIASLGTVVVPCTDEAKRKAGKAEDLVLIHGYASGNALWAANLEQLAKHFNVYAVEWIGIGRSDRPDFPYRDFDSANDFVIKSFEEWRREAKLKKFNLCAHSMGAIFATSYALQFPDYVNHLVLVSPAGVGHPPPPPTPEDLQAAGRTRRIIFKIGNWVWDRSITPMAFARFVGPYGPRLVENILVRRLSYMPETSAMHTAFDMHDLSEYQYHNWALKASSEKTMTTHLAPMAYAVRPLIDMLVPERVKMPITFIYGGEHDWMDYRAGQKVVDQLQASGDHKADLFRIPNSGHQVFLDNPSVFNKVVVDALRF